MKLMDKEQKRAHAEQLADKWGCSTQEQRVKWVKYYEGCFDYVDVDGEHVIKVEKPSIRSEFWYDDEYESPLGGDEAQRKAYFVNENMRHQFKDYGLAEWLECRERLEQGGCCTGLYLYEPFLGVWPDGQCYPHFFEDPDYTRINEANGMTRIPMTDGQIAKLAEIMDGQRDKFAKRLEIYWKRYGDKVSAYGYWANR